METRQEKNSETHQEKNLETPREKKLGTRREKNLETRQEKRKENLNFQRYHKIQTYIQGLPKMSNVIQQQLAQEVLSDFFVLVLLAENLLHMLLLSPLSHKWQ